MSRAEGAGHRFGNAPMLNAYPDSLGETLGGLADFLSLPELEGAFSSLYILPSLFNADLDRGFSVIDYGLNELLASEKDLERIRALGIRLKLDFVINHASVLSGQFQDILKRGDASPYRDFFIDWNKFWAGHGAMTAEGYILPDPAMTRDMFFRKPGLPILMARMPDGRSVPYWNTFYQEVRYPRIDAPGLVRAANMQYASAQRLAGIVNRALDEGRQPGEIDFSPFGRFRQKVTELLESGRTYLGQMDLNARSPLVWQYYDDTLGTLSSYGAAIVRLDAFAYASKEPGARNFLNEPGTWEILKRVDALAGKRGLELLPEIHTDYASHVCDRLADEGYLCYDFYLPGLVLDALETGSGEFLALWAREQQAKGIRAVNMLGCHDGIPLLDLKGFLPESRIDALIDRVVARGGLVKNLHGQKGLYYQVNASYFSALGEDERKLLLARAIQLFMPGIPQVWYLDLFAGKNDLEAAARAGEGGHKEINRTNLSRGQIEAGLRQPVVRNQLRLLRFRNASPAFGFDAALQASEPGPGLLRLTWQRGNFTAVLNADLISFAFTVTGAGPGSGGFVLSAEGWGPYPAAAGGG